MHGLRLRRPVRTGSTAMSWIALTSGAMLLGAGLLAPAAVAASPTPPATVAARLGARHIPAEIVVLVDISASMTADGLYPQVQQVLPGFLSNLRRQDPQDRVAVVVFGAPGDTQTVYLGRPTARSIPLPAKATSNLTDFGYAFQKALGILSQAPADIKVGGVLLMSDGALNAPGDQRYATYSAPGWAKLHAMADGLGISVTGYGLPLTANQAYTQSVNTALAHVFTQRQTLTADLGDVGAQLDLASQQIMDSRIAAAAQPDSGHGVRVSWVDPPRGKQARPRWTWGRPQGDVKVKLTSTTSRIPLSVGGLSVTVSGFPVSVSGRLPGGPVQLEPGRSVTPSGASELAKDLRRDGAPGWLPVRLPRLALTAQVTSPFAAAINGTFADPGFRVGGLTGEASASALGAVPAQSPLGIWALIVVLILAAAAVLVYRHARLQGCLVLKPPDQQPGHLYLPRRMSMAWPTDELIRIPGQIAVRNSLSGKKMRVTLQLDGRVSRDDVQPGGHRMIAGVDIIHEFVSDVTGSGDQNYRPEL